MRICNTRGTGFRCSSAQHESDKILESFFLILPLPPLLVEGFLEELVDHEVDHGFTDSPPGRSHPLPETSNSLKWKEGLEGNSDL